MKYLKQIHMPLLWTLAVLAIYWAVEVPFASSGLYDVDTQWGGHLRVQGSASRVDDETVFQPVGTGNYYDGFINLCLKNKIFYGERTYFETHYEAVVSGGETREKQRRLQKLYPGILNSGLAGAGPLNGQRRLMDLTEPIKETEDYLAYHRLDRLSITFLPEWGSICLGRQAITWGNGILFNPMDLFNPFSPTDIDRDYKTGDDMATIRIYSKKGQEFQLLYVPRRNPGGKSIEWNESSMAGKLHFSQGETEFDVMAAAHYKDFVTGFGTAGYLMDAAWRLAFTWTFLNNGIGRDGFHSAVVNIDYSWTWFEKNIYGLIEFYSNGLGRGNYCQRATDPELLRRLNRGEVFTLGGNYIAGQIQIEIHPLSKFFLTLINNLNDPSGIIQPHVVLDISQDVQCIIGGSIYYGKRGTEYGGFRIPLTNFIHKPSLNAFLNFAWFF